MPSLFLSASVPEPGRGDYFETADPFLIQFAVRELVAAAHRSWHIVWGGHPAITPMVWTVCRDLGIDYARAVTLYQSRFFEGRFPPENAAFGNVVVVDHVAGDLAESLRLLRVAMLSRDDLDAAVFIGGMDGVVHEFEMVRRFRPHARVLPLAAPGGAARALALRMAEPERSRLATIDFATLFRREFSTLRR